MSERAQEEIEDLADMSSENEMLGDSEDFAAEDDFAGDDEE